MQLFISLSAFVPLRTWSVSTISLSLSFSLLKVNGPPLVSLFEIFFSSQARFLQLDSGYFKSAWVHIFLLARMLACLQRIVKLFYTCSNDMHLLPCDFFNQPLYFGEIIFCHGKFEYCPLPMIYTLVLPLPFIFS